VSQQNLVQYRCRRGLLELDLIFSNFYDCCYKDLSEKNKDLFLEFLGLEDNDLWSMLQESQKHNHKYTDLVQLIHKSKKINRS
jgi:antitoxin CptB